MRLVIPGIFFCILYTEAGMYKTGPNPSLGQFCSTTFGYQAVPWDCSGYVQCHVWTSYWHECPSGLFYDESMKTCDWPHQNNVLCPSLKDRVRRFCKDSPYVAFPHPEECAEYFDCGKPGDIGLGFYHRECPYPTHFDSQTFKCSTGVECKPRNKPQTPCEYKLNNNPACTATTPDCKGKANGDYPVVDHLLTNKYITCSNEQNVHNGVCATGVFDPATKQCTTTITQEAVAEACRLGPNAVIPDPFNCAIYYDCRDISNPTRSDFFKYEKECPYPKLFSKVNLVCDDFKNVQCGDRFEPIAPCQYKQNKCYDALCVPCSERLVSCIGKPDGLNPSPRDLFAAPYVVCDSGRTVASGECTGALEIFVPAKRECSSDISKNDAGAFCAEHTNGKIAVSESCAQYINCGNPPTYIEECTYPALYNGTSCVMYDDPTVKCGNRPENQAPCDYEYYRNLCTQSPTCTDCGMTYPSCVGKEDGSHARIGFEFSPKFTVCDSNRTTGVDIDMVCAQGDVFHPVKRKCTNSIDTADATGYCKANSDGIIAIAESCAKYIQCNASGNVVQECPYSKLFSTATLQCENHDTVDCNTGTSRPEPQAPCDYEYYRSLCSQSPACTDCGLIYPSCVGKEDGAHARIGEEFSTRFTRCDGNRTIGVDTDTACATGYVFHPVKRVCTNLIDTADATGYCNANSDGIIAIAERCAKYIQCNASGDVVQECPYSKLFSTVTLQCENHDTVDCNAGTSRPEPQAPCEYDHYKNLCSADGSCTTCGETYPSCVGKPDGPQAPDGWGFSKKFIVCSGNRTTELQATCELNGVFHPIAQSCVTAIAPGEADSFCQNNPNGRVALLESCAKYIECNATGDHVQECPYPQLFSVEKLQCDDFTTVDCSSGSNTRPEPQSPCEYAYYKELCSASASCTNCDENYSSCVGKPDGTYPVEGKEWSNSYYTCSQNRTLDIDSTCSGPNEIFNPYTKECVSAIHPLDTQEYCASNPSGIMALSDGCARYINCSSGETEECPYPKLFSTISLTCEDFAQVDCSKGTDRPEPVSPCDYTYYQNLCQASVTCTTCSSVYPSCEGKSDGYHATVSFFGKDVFCSGNRTLGLDTCSGTNEFFDQAEKVCKNAISEVNEPDFCALYPNGTVAVLESCARFSKCNNTSGNSECPYPLLFSTQTLSCRNYTDVNCADGSNRTEPKAPCDYTYYKNLCDLSSSCTTCSDEYPSCVGKTDGIHAHPGKPFSSTFISCIDGRTDNWEQSCTGVNEIFHPRDNKCTTAVGEGDSTEYCQANPNGIVAITDSCAKYIQCNASGEVVQECTYPKLFSTTTLSCEDFANVDCNAGSTRNEPKAPCEYDQFIDLCQSSASCTNCPDEYPSCVGKSDGPHPHTGKEYTNSYVICLNNRTVDLEKRCNDSNEIYHPVNKVCTTAISSGDSTEYCQANPNGIVAVTDSCAKYIQCNASGEVVQECTYPKLFSTTTLSCEDFANVDCNAGSTRNEPQAPCEYDHFIGLCKSSVSCVTCNDEYPSCVGKSDGPHPHTGKEFTNGFVMCLNNRTVDLEKTCNASHEIFHPTDKVCTNAISSGDVGDFCALNPDGLIANTESCAKYIQCNATDTPVQECGYYTLFSTQTMKCDNHSNVDCNDGTTRIEPVSPCDYIYYQKLCAASVSCTSCNETYPSCFGQPDGPQSKPGSEFSGSYIVCVDGRTTDLEAKCDGKSVFHPVNKVCTDAITPDDSVSFCASNSDGIIGNAESCAQYFDCSNGSQILQECPYPQLFSTITLMCADFQTVECNSRPEPVSYCQYQLSICNVTTDPSCQPCSDTLPSCIGLPDGNNAVPGMEFTNTYLTCLQNRTLEKITCTEGIYVQSYSRCTTAIDPSLQFDFCTANPSGIIANSENCAQYFNCTQSIMVLQECPYPNLFSTITLDCQNFASVICGERFEPQSPCDYPSLKSCNQTLNSSCIPCEDYLPSCDGLPDGLNGYPGEPYTSGYVSCSQNRTLREFRCDEGIFLPDTKECTSKIAPDLGDEFCVHNTGTIATTTDCTKYIDCSANNGTAELECPYPQLYSTVVRRCEENFTSVDCQDRPELQDYCQYEQSSCDPATPATCDSCKEKLPSCVGLPDGSNPISDKLYKSEYIVCHSNRTLERVTCPGGIFVPVTLECATAIDPAIAGEYCANNPNGLIRANDSCAKYISCVQAEPVRECTYPSLFSPTELQCKNFTDVQCGSVNEPITFCEYEQSQCSGCPDCNDVLPSCVGLPDGYNGIPGKKYTASYILCSSNRTMEKITCDKGVFDPVHLECTEDIYEAVSSEFCENNPHSFVASADNCARYINCTSAGGVFAFRMECTYPDLFSIEANGCMHFQNVTCDTRVEPQAFCEYTGSGCPTCPNCNETLPSCVGLPDGMNSISGKEYTTEYIVCLSNRTMEKQSCDKGVFDPTIKKCTEQISEAAAPDYCAGNTGGIIGSASSCAKYINCTATPQIQECDYPSLFSTALLRCDNFTQVDCGSVFEPQNYCDYEASQCAGCPNCSEAKPSCVGLPDGYNAPRGMEYTTKFIVCLANRTVEVSNCSNGIFHPVSHTCTGSIRESEVNDFCAANSNGVLGNAENCAQYIQCSQTEKIQECTYPDLFDTVKMECSYFENVDCGSRFEPQSLCQYEKSVCQPSDTSCVPCEERKPSCIGLQDGENAVPGKELTNQLMICIKNRTVSVETCLVPGYVFSPRSGECVNMIHPDDAPLFCQNNINNSFEIATTENCAQYINCSHPDKVVECPYPDLFNTGTQQCDSFENVDCLSRFEPQAPCQYKANQCQPTATKCIPCEKRETDCRGLADDMYNFHNNPFTTPWVKCYKNRTINLELCSPGVFDPILKNCTDDIRPDSLEQYCTENPDVLIEHYKHCGQFINCTSRKIEECVYPQLFDADLQKCTHFSDVYCYTRPEPVNPCDYIQFQCNQTTDPGCTPCEDLPTCEGKEDGQYSIPDQPFYKPYVMCVSGRIFPDLDCPSLVFDPVLRTCIDHINETSIQTFCQDNPTTAFLNPLNCAQIFNCSLAEPRVECSYPDLVDGSTMQCKTYSNVTCGDRFEPQAPCDYHNIQSECPSCTTTCVERNPTCVGLNDGSNPYAGREGMHYYITCESNRTMSINECKGTRYLSESSSCGRIIVDGLLSIYCEDHPKAIFESPMHCAQYYNCSATENRTYYGQFLEECEYLYYFDTVSQSCALFMGIDCGFATAYVDKCDYIKTRETCDADTECTNCTQTNPSCDGLPDGMHEIPHLIGTKYYMVCFTQFLLETKECAQGIFMGGDKRHCESTTITA